MSKLRDKSDAVLAQGIDDRGYWEPQGAPLNVYNWFYRHNYKNPPSRENFCHFWRIVLIWSPLMLLLVGLEKFFSSTVRTALFLVALVAVIFYLGATVSWWVPGTVGLGLGGFAVFLGLVGLVEYIDDHDFGPGAKRFGSFLGGAIIAIISAAIATAIVIGFYTLIVNYGWTVLWFSLILLGAVIVVVAVAVLASVAFDYFNTKHKDKRAVAINKALTEGATFEEAKDTKTKRFFRNIGEFLVLIAQVVKVNKWKICPIVTIERPEPDDAY